MKDGQYGSHFEKTGYITQYFGTGDSLLKAVRIAARQDPIRLRIELVAYATLRGGVLDPDGRPVAKATVTLGLATETTDDQGQFAFVKLSPASYTLEASPESGANNSPAQTPGEDRTEIVATWFPSAVESDLAEHIVVRGGANLSGYEITLRTAPYIGSAASCLGRTASPRRAPSSLTRRLRSNGWISACSTSD
jgi:hypothetical protein